MVPLQHDLEMLDPRGRTPLELAVSLGNLESARVLLRHNASVGQENVHGWTGMDAWLRVHILPAEGARVNSQLLSVPGYPVMLET